MIGGYVRLDPNEIPTIMRTRFPATVMGFGVVSSVLDSAANGGRPYVFQQDSVLFHNAHKTQDWMDG
ncbi:hypothetical protein ACTXT7_003142 [Hymenolepis weldensis]